MTELDGVHTSEEAEELNVRIRQENQASNDAHSTDLLFRS